jgi:hypothetical protein
MAALAKNGQGNEHMPIFVLHNGKYYKIPEEVLDRSAISKARFENRLEELKNTAAERAKTLPHPKLIEFAHDEFDNIVTD